jgi:hypothetical protein
MEGQALEESMRKGSFGLTVSALPFALSSVGALLFSSVFPLVQQPTKIYRIGLLSAGCKLGISGEALR